MLKRKKLFGIKVVVSNLHEAAEHVAGAGEELKGKYISFANAHTTVMAHKDREFHRVQKEAFYVMPDGRPLSKLLRLRGYGEAGQIAGPDFMDALWRASVKYHKSHYFYGGSEETIKGLRKILEEKYPDVIIAGMESPPYRPLTEEEDRAVVERINSSGADFIWIGLGAPKQEIFMNEHKDRMNGVMLGVGAGFDFYSGTVNRAPKWMRKIYLEWLYRLSQEPGRLWKRYLVTNTEFAGMVFIYGLRCNKRKRKTSMRKNGESFLNYDRSSGTIEKP